MTGKLRGHYWAWFCVAGLASATGCDKKEDQPAAAPAPSATTATPGASAAAAAPSAAASASAAPSTGKAVTFMVTAGGKTTIDMPAPKEHIKADTSAAGGELTIDPMNLANTRGQVKADVSTLKTTTFGDASKDTKQTEHALTWLEVGDKSTPEMKEKNRWATFDIRSIDGLSAPDASKVAPTKDAAGDVRTVTLTAHGDFTLHGHKVPKDAALEVRLHYPSGAPADSNPTSLDLASKAPLHVILADHDVKPRDSFGALAQGAFGLLGTKVAETADVTFDLHATPSRP